MSPPLCYHHVILLKSVKKKSFSMFDDALSFEMMIYRMCFSLADILQAPTRRDQNHDFIFGGQFIHSSLHYNSSVG